jgi:hypothetical protein
LLKRIRELIGARPPQPNSNVDSISQWLKQILGITSERCPKCGDQLIEQSLPGRLPRKRSRLTRLRSTVSQPRGPPG